MSNRNAVDSSQVEVSNTTTTSSSVEAELSHSESHNENKTIKSGPLFVSSRGIGWTSWKKRWFTLTSTSLVFFRTDPNAIPPKGTEVVNVTLGGIDLNSSGSVIIDIYKKLITVQFPDSRDTRDGRTFTLKAETMEDLYEWKIALEEAIENAPDIDVKTGENELLKNNQVNTANAPSNQSNDKQPAKSMVIGRPILLALEDIDGTPSFLEKALQFVEEHGYKVEGILRQAAYVDDVERRIREYEQGKTEFSSDEDAHVIADCVKYVLRELPSAPVPASCCNALLEAHKTDRDKRVSAIQNAICETFPEPNRRLFQRILKMMQAIAAHTTKNRMNISAVAACMAPLLLRPLLSGECELDQNFDADDDGSAQLLQAAAAANHAQSICITLLEEYDNLFGERTVELPDIYSDTEESESETEELSEDNESPAYSGDHNKEKKAPSMVSIDEAVKEESEILRLEATKAKLQNSIAEEAKGIKQLLESLGKGINGLQGRRVALEKDVSRLEEYLQKKREIRAILELEFKGSQSNPSPSHKKDNQKEENILGASNTNLNSLERKHVPQFYDLQARGLKSS